MFPPSPWFATSVQFLINLVYLTYVPLYYAIVGSFQYKIAAAFFAGDRIPSSCTFKMLNLLTSRAF
jgi:hypothetical protein